MSDLLTRAKEIKNATEIGENTAERVGGVMVDTIKVIPTTILIAEYDFSMTKEDENRLYSTAEIILENSEGKELAKGRINGASDQYPGLMSIRKFRQVNAHEEAIAALTQKNLASFTSLEYDGNLVIDESVNGPGVPTLPLSLSKGDKIFVRLTPTAKALVARLKKDGVNVVTLVQDDNYPAGQELTSIIELDSDIDSIILYSTSTVDVQVISSLVAKSELENNDGVTITPIVNKKGEDVLLTHQQGKTRKASPTLFYAPFQRGKKYRLIAKTDGVGISIYLKKNDVSVQNVVDLPNMAATDHYEIDFLCNSDANGISLWSYGIVEFTAYEIVETIEDLSGRRYVSQCVNNLVDSYENMPLSAKQGVLLNDKVAKTKNIVNQLPSWESILEGKMIKFFHLDCGRKYFSPSNIKIMLDRMRENGFNTFIVHFSEDQGFRFKLNDMMIDVDGETYDLSLAIGRGISLGDKLIEPSDKYISEAEMDDIIAYAANYGIQVIPSFDMPSHTGAICKAFPQFAINNRTIDFTDGRAVNFMLAIIDKYAAYFKSKGSKIYNLGCDELSVDVSDGYTRENYFGFLNRAVDKIESYGMRAAMYNDYITADCGISKNVLVLYWTHSAYKDVDEIENAGYKILNYSYDLYWALGRYKTVKYEDFDIWQAFQSKKIVNPLGAGWCCWCDNADHDGTDEGAAMLTDTADIFVGVGNALNSQTKKVVATLPSMTIGNGEIKSIDVEIPQGSFLDKVIAIEGINCNVVGYSNIDCKTDIRLNSLHDGTIRLFVTNIGDSLTVAEGTKITIHYL